MPILPGQGLLLKGFFANGSECSYARPFIVIENTDSVIKALNVSSLRGKEHKLGYSSNQNLTKFKPPFLYPSFAKLDELYEIEDFPELVKTVLARGATLDATVLSTLISAFQSYNATSAVVKVQFSNAQLIERNPQLAAASTPSTH